MRRIRFDRRVGLLLGGVLLLTFVALGASVALPASDPDLGGEAPEMSRAEARGMVVYRSEGCWYCHTRYVRNSRTDAGLGEPLPPRAYSAASPAMLGLERIGPDLTHVDMPSAAIVELLSGRGDAAHRPSYGYLSEEDVRALAAFLLSLE